MKTKITSFIATALIAASCSSGFMEEYSQDLSRVQSAEDLNELLMGDCTMPLSYFYYNYGGYTENENYLLLHFLGDEMQETMGFSLEPSGLYNTKRYFAYFTWQRDAYIDDEGAETYKSYEEEYWNLAYEKINNCNMVIEAADALSTSNADDDALRRHVMGECLYLRAVYYSLLVNLYAKPYAPATAATTPGVPVKTTGEVVDAEFSRNSVAEVYQQIVADLERAEELLADVASPQTIYHVGINAVYIQRSRMALYMQDWTTAKRYAELAIRQNDYLQDMRGWSADAYPISDKNKEVLYSNGASCFGNLIFESPGRRSTSYYNYSPAYAASDNLVALYDDNDGRKRGYITDKDDVNNSPAYWTYHKIDNSRASWGTYKTVSDVFSIRTAEAYLNLAEAEAQLGNDAAACQWLSQLRQRRIDGDAAVSGLSGKQLIEFIRDERQRELCFEGHRWFDLRRYQVDVKCPYSKAIEHSYTWYVYVNYDNIADHTSYYRLEPNDDAYTLNIPKNTRDFQNSIGSNPRPDRQPFKTENRRADDEEEDW
ncbi:MAG: RagB/SusD family nutrient uptake outer membrane protein [Prevotella sp.]